MTPAVLGRSLTTTLLLVSLQSLLAQEHSDPERCGELQAVVSGTVRGPNGRPVPNARVTYYGMHWEADCRSGWRAVYQTVADSSGFYQIRVAPGRGRALRFEHSEPEFPPEFQIVDVLSLIENRVDHKFERFQIEGRVFGPGGQPLRDGLVVYFPKPSSPICGTGLPEALVVAGKFEAVAYSRAVYVFSVRPRPGDIGIPGITSFIAIQRDTSIAFMLDGPVLDGHVRTREGFPIVGAPVSVMGPCQSVDRTDSSGFYSLRVTPGVYRVRVEPRDMSIEAQVFPAVSIHDSVRMDLTLRGVRWEGTVVSEAGEPVDSVRISVWEDYESIPPSGYATSLTDARGRFTLTLNRGGNFDMHLVDAQLESIPRRPSRDADSEVQEMERIEREYGRVRSAWFRGVRTGEDSTFTVRLESVRH